MTNFVPIRKEVSVSSKSAIPYLKDEVLILKDKSFCLVIDKIFGDLIKVHPSRALIFSLCNGSCSVEDIVRIFASTYKIPRDRAKDIVIQTLNVRSGGYIELMDKPLLKEWRYRPEDFLYVPEGENLELVLPYSRPVEMVLVLTNRCNFRCVYCYRGSGEAWANELSGKELLDVVDQASRLGIVRCAITGGEPTLHPNFMDAVSRALELGIFPYISTNGAGLTRKQIVELSKMGLKLIQVSLDANVAELHDSMVGISGTFKKVIQNIQQLANMNIKVRIKCVVTSINKKHIDDLIDLCYKLGVHQIGFEGFNPGIHGRGDNKLFLDKESEECVVRAVDKKIGKYKGKMRIEPFQLMRRWKCKDDIVNCGGMISAFVVQPNGDVCICENLGGIPEYIMGNIRYDKLENIWESEKAIQFLNPDKSELPKKCRGCKFYRLCRRGCPNLRLLFSKEYPFDPRCWNAHVDRCRVNLSYKS